jgi:hypothetical protein
LALTVRALGAKVVRVQALLWGHRKAVLLLPRLLLVQHALVVRRQRTL